MAKLGGGVDELQVNLLKGPAFGLHQQGLWAESGGLVRKGRPFPVPSYLTSPRTGSKPESACCGDQAASPRPHSSLSGRLHPRICPHVTAAATNWARLEFPPPRTSKTKFKEQQPPFSFERPSPNKAQPVSGSLMLTTFFPSSKGPRASPCGE